MGGICGDEIDFECGEFWQGCAVIGGDEVRGPSTRGRGLVGAPIRRKVIFVSGS